MSFTNTFAQDRRNEMVAAAERRTLVKAARAARKANRSTDRRQGVVANLFTRTSPAPAETPAPATEPSETHAAAA
jgi:hypothetical protein